jgi:hypothetical protein
MKKSQKSWNVKSAQIDFLLQKQNTEKTYKIYEIMGCISSKIKLDPNTFQVVYADSKEGVFWDGQLKISRE